MAKLAFLSLLLLFLVFAICLEAKSTKLKKTEMVFYMHDWEIPTKESNVTVIAIAGNPKTKMYILNYGTVYVLDDPLTLGIERNSTEIGRARGTYINSALDGSDLHLLFSLVFSEKRYNGSTVQIQGSDRFFLKYRDVSVVGGTGVFRMARGWATLETVFLDLVNLNAIIKFNLTVFHY